MENKDKIQILKDIININSTNGNEEEVANYLENLLKKYNIDSEKILYSENRSNLVSTLGKKGGKVLGFSGHMDVVDSGDPDKWDTPPFSATEKNGKLFGRGATDMKAGLAALVITMIELKEEDQPLNGEIKLLATVGEEIGELGAEQLTSQGYADDLDGLLIAEPSGHQIIYAHKGSVNYTVTSLGKNAHSSMPEMGINALDNLMLFYNEIQKYTDNISVTNDVLGDFTHAITILNGGNQVNSIPEQAVLQGNIRTIPELDNEKIKNDMEKIIEDLNKQKDINLKLAWDFDKIPVFSSPDSDLLNTAQDSAKKIIGKKMPILGIAGTTDAAEFIKANNEFSTIIFGPGNETPHQINEHVDIDNYLEMIDLFKDLAINYLK